MAQPTEPLSFRAPEVKRPHTVIRIPQSHTLHVGPPSCIRRHMLHAYTYGDAEHTSFLAIGESDVASGCYEDRLIEAVGETLATVRPEPALVFVNTFCIDDFLGTDDDALVDQLTTRYPGHRFVAQHTRPVVHNDKLTMSEMKRVNVYAFLEPVAPDEHDRGVNLIGSFSPIDPDCELFELFERWGVGPVRELFACATYAEYTAQARSCGGLVLRSTNPDTLRDMRERLGIPLLEAPACYDPEQVAHTYARMARLFGAPEPDCSSWLGRTRATVERTRELVGDTPLCVDCQASLMPFALACALLDAGFNVTHVLRSRRLFDPDAPARDRLARDYPHVAVHRRDDASFLRLARQEGGHPEMIAIGSDGLYVLQAGALVDMWHDEGFYGFQGIDRLMERIRDAHRTLAERSASQEGCRS